MDSALRNFVVIEELMDYAGRVIAKKTGAEDGCPTSGAASGLVIATAACIAGCNLGLIERIPDTEGLKNEIILQKGQSINFGGSITQMLRLGGGVPVEAGCSNKVERDNIESAINEKTAALLYVKSHHAVQKGMVSMEAMAELAKKYSLPLIIDAAAEEDLCKYIAMGADLVLYSGGKALSGPTSGMIAGKSHYIAACKMQYKGVGRAMKVSKEAMAGLITALEEYDPARGNPGEQKKRMQFVCGELGHIKGLNCRVTQDEAGREIYRAEIHVGPEAGMNAAKLNELLKKGDPAIYMREYYVNQGILSIDPRPLFDGQEKIIIDRIKSCLSEE
jgi:L-seryl-tRNA(Ser) seleniumtransferase/D-glucosaminate-6-phosphate ammonia-lyase